MAATSKHPSVFHGVVACALLFCALWLAAPAQAAPGDLDPTFSGDGKLTTDFGANEDADGVAVQADGKIIVAGPSADAPTFEFLLVRYNADGSLDTSFDGDGKVTTDFGSASDVANAVVIQPDGKIVVAGQSAGNFGIARYNADDGSLDTSFDTDGKQTTDFGTTEGVISLAIAPDGKIVAAGYTIIGGIAYDFALARYNADDGSLDTSFDTDGKQTTDFGSSEIARAVITQPDGKIVAAGDSSGDFALARYNTDDGSLDTSFDTDGKQTTDFGGGSSDVGKDAVLQTDGKVVVAGSSSDDFALARYTTNGSLDASFDTDGKQTTDLGGGTDSGNAVAMQSDGKLVVAGVSVPVFALARYNPDGSLDGSFSGDGKETTSFNGEDSADAVAVQADGKIVAAGQTYNGTDDDFALARYRIDSTQVTQDQQQDQQGPPGLLPGNCANLRTGTPGKDTLNGTTAGDRLLGLAGNDILNGLQANDCLDGGPGRDRLAGGSGNDRLAGAAGGDKLSGGSGKDRLAGGAAKDSLNAGTGNDRADGGAGNDVIDGGSGNDTLKGGSGNDTLKGGPGNDRINGGTGRNSFSGGAGNDAIAAANGRRERINCGRGRDKVTADRIDRLTGCERVSRLRRAR